jgi:hypothetical protein
MNSNPCHFIVHSIPKNIFTRSLTNLHITKSKNSESFYIAKSYVKSNGSTSSMIVRKTRHAKPHQLLEEHGSTRDDVLAWAKNEVKLEKEKYKTGEAAKTVLIPLKSPLARWVRLTHKIIMKEVATKSTPTPQD